MSVWQSLVTLVGDMSWTDRLLICAGAVVALTGLVMVARARRAGRALRHASPDMPAATPAGNGDDAALSDREPSLATRFVLGLVVLFTGYHMVVWGLPPGLTPLKVDESWWWTVPLCGGLLVALSRQIDRLDHAGSQG